MSRFFVKCALIVAVFLAVGLLFAAQSFGTAQAPPADSPAATAFTADWAVLGVLAVGALVMLLKPRRRVAADREETED
jgi:hypothetical protein